MHSLREDRSGGGKLLKVNNGEAGEEDRSKTTNYRGTLEDGTLADNISCVARDQRETSGVAEGNRSTPLDRRQHDEGPNFTAMHNLNEWAADASGVIITLWYMRQRHFLHVFTNLRVVFARSESYLTVPHLMTKSSPKKSRKFSLWPKNVRRLLQLIKISRHQMSAAS